MIKHLLALLLALMLPVILVLSTTRLIMTETYLNIEYHKADFPPDYYGFTLEDRLHFGPYAVRYVFNGEGIDYLGNLKISENMPLYTESELSHLADVKNVVRLLFTVLILMLVIAFAISIFLAIKDRRVLWSGLFGGSLLTLVLLGGLTIFALVGWDTFFTQFHELFFSGGNWVFSYSDSLIRLYPIRFWQDGAFTLGALTGIEAVIVLGVSFWRLRALSVKDTP